MDYEKRQMDMAAAMAFAISCVGSVAAIMIGVPVLAPIAFLVVSVVMYLKAR